MVLMPLLSRLLTLLVILTMPLFLARLTLIPIKSLSICFRSEERFSRNPRPISYAVFCLKKKTGAYRGGLARLTAVHQQGHALLRVVLCATKPVDDVLR